MLSIKVYLKKKCARDSSCMKKVCTAQMIFNSLTGDYLTSCSIHLLQKNKLLQIMNTIVLLVTFVGFVSYNYESNGCGIIMIQSHHMHFNKNNKYSFSLKTSIHKLNYL